MNVRTCLIVGNSRAAPPPAVEGILVVYRGKRLRVNKNLEVREQDEGSWGYRARASLVLIRKTRSM